MTRVAARDWREVAKRAPDDSGAAPLARYAYRPSLQGGSITMDAEGRRLYAVDRDDGTLVVVDARTLRVETTARICERPESVVVSRAGRAFVACRGSAEVVALDPRSSEKAVRARVGAEPFGLALAPDGRTVFVTTANDGRLHALAAASLRPRWSLAVGAHARGVAISPDGRWAVVAHLVGRAATVVDVRARRIRSAALPAKRDGWPSELHEFTDLAGSPARVPGGAFAVAMSPGGTRAFVPYLLRNDGAAIEEFVPGCYANGASVPVAPSIAAVDVGTARVQRPRPIDRRPSSEDVWADTSILSTLANLGVVRAAFHDPKHSRLFVVGEGSGLLVAFDTSNADPTVGAMRDWFVGGAANGLVVDPEGERAYVHLADHRITVVPLDAVEGVADRSVSIGPDGDPALRAGEALFHAANDHRISAQPGIACSTCHLDGRADGVTWRLDGAPLQTPMLAGRVAHDGPLRWHGDSPDLGHAIREAVTRLGGGGLEDDAVAQLAAYLRAMPRPVAARGPERGREVFESAGCASCHAPEADFADGLLHDVRGARVRTPSLRGAALTAPYLHDGSARDLETLLGSTERGNPMAVGTRLSREDRAALAAYVRSL